MKKLDLNVLLSDLNNFTPAESVIRHIKRKDSNSFDNNLDIETIAHEVNEDSSKDMIKDSFYDGKLSTDSKEVEFDNNLLSNKKVNTKNKVKKSNDSKEDDNHDIKASIGCEGRGFTRIDKSEIISSKTHSKKIKVLFLKLRISR